jgi:ABC-type multidrug transport system ATPase subunit
MKEIALRRRITDVLELVGLMEASDRIGFALSAGMRARLLLGRALLHHPPVLILDEPTGAVDPVGSYQLLQTIQQVAKEEGASVLLSSHRLEEIEALHDNVILLDRGELLHSGDLASLRRRSETPLIDLIFDSTATTSHAVEKIRHVEKVDIVRTDALGVTVATSLPIGQLLEHLDGQLAGLSSVSETRMPLRNLLAEIFASRRGAQFPEEQP